MSKIRRSEGLLIKIGLRLTKSSLSCNGLETAVFTFPLRISIFGPPLAQCSSSLICIVYGLSGQLDKVVVGDSTVPGDYE